MANKGLSRREALRRAGGAFLAGMGAAGVSACAMGAKSGGKMAATTQRNSMAPGDKDVLQFGAAGDGTTLDTAAIQRAIDAAAGTRGGRVIIAGRRKYLIGSLLLRTGIELHLAEGASLVLSDKRADYAGSDANGGIALAANGAENFRITGGGTIEGRSPLFMERYDPVGEWWKPKRWRPRVIALTECRGIEIRDITIQQAPSWTLHLLGCEHVLIDGVNIQNQLDVPNCDGIDPDHCRDVIISNCRIVCGDDAVAIKTTRQARDYGPCANITVKDCNIETQDSGLKIGTETTRDIHDITFIRCVVRRSGRAACIQLRDEGNIYGITFQDIQFKAQYFADPWWGKGEALSFTCIPRTVRTKVGQLRDIRVSGLTGYAENSVRVEGVADQPVKSVLLDGVSVEMGRWTKYRGGMFDDRPTSARTPIEAHATPGFFLRYVDGIILRDCRVTWGLHPPAYFTSAVEAEAVKGLQLQNFTGWAAHPGRDEAIVQRDEPLQPVRVPPEN